MMRKTVEKMREYDRQQWEKMGKEGKMMRTTMEKRRDFDIKQWKKIGKQWKRWKEQGEGNMMPSKIEAPMWDHYW